MRDKWYGDKRDLVKWATLIELAQRFGSKHILQVLYYRPTAWMKVEVDGKNIEIPIEVTTHLRDVRAICGMKCDPQIELVEVEFDNDKRQEFLETLKETIKSRIKLPGIVFLDPDTGLEPESGRFGPTHVRSVELLEIWESLSVGDVLVLYQHQTNRKGVDFVGPKKRQFAQAIGTTVERAKHAYAPSIARDVAFLFAEK
ncbi:MAG: hypothetical protein ABSD61_12090 [Terracidiphilus sp.]|jgi:hypothetical protein